MAFGEDVGRDVAAEIRRLADEIPARRYRPRALRRVWVRKRGKEDEFRPLAIPGVRDGVAAGAAHQVLEHVFESLYHDSSWRCPDDEGIEGSSRTPPANRRR